MAFTIYTQPTRSAKVASYLDGKQPTAVPHHLTVGVVNKPQKYKEWLQEQFKTNNRFVGFVAKIVETAEANGHIALLVRSKINNFQVLAFKEFLLENLETIKVMTPYLKQGMIGLPQTSDTSELGTAGTMTLADLPENDRNQIAALLAQNDVLLPMDASKDKETPAP